MMWASGEDMENDGVVAWRDLSKSFDGMRFSLRPSGNITPISKVAC